MAEEKGIAKEDIAEKARATTDSSLSEWELARRRLRQRWELASVLNFLIVFEPVVGKDLKISAEEIETALINANTLLAHLHITLLKGIPPVSKNLVVTDAWVSVLSKKLALWWPWVAEGEIPITMAKGEEIARYKELDPTIRLLILKALCEVRANQEDLLSYINHAIKRGTQLSCFRKDSIGEVGKGITYWYDGNSNIGHRLYREVKNFDSVQDANKGCAALPSITWETVATNLEEFQKVANEFAFSKLGAEFLVCKTIETNAIPDLVKIQKKKDRALKRKERHEMLLTRFHHSGIRDIRSCRNRRPVKYTFDEYDQAIDEAIQLTKKKTPGEQTCSRERPTKKHSSFENDTDKDKFRGSSVIDSDDDDDDEYEYDNNFTDTVSTDSDKENVNLGNKNNATQNTYRRNESFVNKPKGLRWSKRLAGISSHPVLDNIDLGAKNRSRQRPTRNTALETLHSDSEDGNLMETASNEKSGGELPCIVPDSEEECDA